MRLMIGNLSVAATILFIVTCAVVFRAVKRYRQMRTTTLQLEVERALDQDAVRLAAAKLKFRNILAKQGQRVKADPLRDLYGVDVPTDCRIS